MHADLELLQRHFAQGLIEPGLMDEALTTFKGDPDLNRERFALYRGNIVAIWQQTLANAYPVLQRLLGADFFNDLARIYGQTMPSLSGNLTELGAALPDFIGSLENCRAYPYLSDVASLEWRVHQAYYAEHSTAITLAELATFPPEQLGELQCRLQPDCALFESPWSVAAIWSAHQNEPVVFPDNLAEQTYCLIWRQPWQTRWDVQVSPLSCASYVALTALQNGQSLGAAIEMAVQEDPEFAVQTALADWFSRQLFVSASLT